MFSITFLGGKQKQNRNKKKTLKRKQINASQTTNLENTTNCGKQSRKREYPVKKPTKAFGFGARPWGKIFARFSWRSFVVEILDHLLKLRKNIGQNSGQFFPNRFYTHFNSPPASWLSMGEKKSNLNLNGRHSEATQAWAKARGWWNKTGAGQAGHIANLNRSFLDWLRLHASRRLLGRLDERLDALDGHDPAVRQELAVIWGKRIQDGTGVRHGGPWMDQKIAQRFVWKHHRRAPIPIAHLIVTVHENETKCKADIACSQCTSRKKS